jgi:transposase
MAIAAHAPSQNFWQTRYSDRLLVNAEGRPVRLELTAGQAGEAPMAAKLLDTVAPGATVIADKANDTDGIRSFVAARGAWAKLPPRSMRKGTFAFSRWVYRQRNLVERFFNRIKQMRGSATRYDQRPDNFLAAIKLAAVHIWIDALRVRFLAGTARSRTGILKELPPGSGEVDAFEIAGCPPAVQAAWFCELSFRSMYSSMDGVRDRRPASTNPFNSACPPRGQRLRSWVQAPDL